MKKLLLLLLLLASPALAQQTVITRPYVGTTTNYSTTITTTNTFQTVIPLNTNRVSCTVQNKGASDMWIYFGPSTSATKAASVLLSSQQALSCIVGSAVLKEEVAITGTQGQEFYAVGQ